MRKLLAIALMGGVLIVSTSAAFAQDDTAPNQGPAAHNTLPAPFPLPLLPLTPYVSNTPSQ